MPTSPLDFLFDKYHTSGAHSVARSLYFQYLQSPLITRWHFGMKVLPINRKQEPRVIYFNITTILLQQVLEAKMRRSPHLKLLEIGVGSFAVLCGYLSRLTDQTIDATDINQKFIDSSKKHIELNDVNVHVFYSDIFANIPPCKYDLIFWNPYYDLDPDNYMPRLFATVSEFLSDRGQLLLAYGTRSLTRQRVLDFLSQQKEQLRVVEIKTWWWNPHEVIIIEKNT
ncbi:hypothetical protein DO97_09190 [Neosynechococcus sphagnicola sy1]|uniref:Methyltransferase small domain-containing protein n=1 Tax=Neosynechococcus sphagnicola sy1 TaxID=1497020 RepID=A0A098TJL0_9CYAN|nr:methyltransferase [Neosynechococcus sphagnicola]KGF72376.1 hypothetical protein DO97_09190 [Neosynechococcus sphagnicola sy1]